MRRIRFRRPSPAMAVAMVALFVALGGTGYAALELPRHSVGKKQLKRNAVTTTKIADGTLRLRDFKRSELRKLTGGSGGADGLDGVDGFDGLDGADGQDGEDGADGATGSALLTGGASGLAAGRQQASLNDHDDAGATETVAGLSPGRDLTLRNLTVAVRDEVSSGQVAFEIVARPLTGFDDPDGNVVIGCNVTPAAGAGTDTCTAPGPATLPADRLVYMRITVSGGADPGRAYWGVSAEPFQP